MRKIKYLVALLSVSVIANANPVLGPTAATVAGNYYAQTYHAEAATLALAYTEKDANGEAVYYVYNINTEGGFVIVSAEDGGYPIIGSSNTGHYVVPTTNNNVAFWMNNRKSEIIAMRANNVQATTDVSNRWNAYIHNTPITHQSMSAVAPLLGSIQWDQSPNYNAMCPGSPSKSVTGCVATAMAQIMKYWAYPSVGISNWCYYDQPPSYTENYGELCADFDTSHYVWTAMPNELSGPNAQVAKLMYDCGVSVDMDYSPSGSGAFVIGSKPSAQNSYVEFFGYNQWSIKGVLQSHYSASAWVSLIEGELNARRPVQYQGTDPTEGGHSWVCDGYSDTGSFHMNWGWSGYDDGYYDPTDLAPTGSGYDFSQEVGALIGIQPNVAGVAKVSNNVSFKIYPNPSNGIFNISIESVTNASTIAVYNVLGQQVYSSKLTTIQSSINLSNQPKGVYLYRVLSENGESISTGRLVIE